jgi:hypothetical protein
VDTISQKREKIKRKNPNEQRKAWKWARAKTGLVSGSPSHTPIGKNVTNMKITKFVIFLKS